MSLQRVSKKHGHLCGSSAHWRERFDASFKRPKSFVFVVFCLPGIVLSETDSERDKEWKGVRASKKTCISHMNLFVDGVNVSRVSHCTERCTLLYFLFTVSLKQQLCIVSSSQWNIRYKIWTNSALMYLIFLNCSTFFSAINQTLPTP